VDDDGQSALFDAFLFFVVALVASAAVLAYATLTLEGNEAQTRADALAYAEDVRVALMRSTLDKPWYLNGTGARVYLGQGITVERFLMDEIQLLGGGLSSAQFSVTDSLILDRAESLVRSPFRIGIEASLSGAENTANLWLGDGAGPPPERFSAPWTYDAIDGAEVRIAVHLWYA